MQAQIYLDRTATSVELMPGYIRRYDDPNWAIWIDLNCDAVFGNDESLFTGNRYSTITGNVVNRSITAAGLTRMRIINRNGILNACKLFEYFEEEDYSVVLLH